MPGNEEQRMKLWVLISAYNGEKYLREQLESLLHQTLPGTGILVRDDGSTDGTRSILEAYRKQGLLQWTAGENLGWARSFWHLIRNCADADFYALCDQDDLWDADKLETAVSALEKESPDLPALYCCDVRVADENMQLLKQHMTRPEKTDYPHALLRNLVPGATFVFNHAAMKRLRQYDADHLGIELHDWTIYQIIACFGHVVYDPRPHMVYRQHAGNVIGPAYRSARELLLKAGNFWKGSKKCSRSRQALRLEKAYGTDMDAACRELTTAFAHYPEDRGKKRILLKRNCIGLRGLELFLFRLLVLLNRL